MATAPFVYREAAPGQQAVQYAQLQEQGESDRRRTIAQAYHDMSTQATEMARNNAQMAAARSQMNQRSAELEKDRALQREGYQSAENIQAGRTKATEDAWDRRAKAQTDAEAAEVKRQARAFFQAGFSDAAMMNDPKVPQAVKDKISLGRNVRPSPDGKTWVNAHPDPDLPEKGMQTMDDLKAAEAARNAGIRASVQPGASGDKTGGWGKRTRDIEGWKNGTSPVTPRTSMGRDGWTSKPPTDPAPAPSVPRAPFNPNSEQESPPQFPSTYDGWLDYNPGSERGAASPRPPFSNTGRLRMGDDNLESPVDNDPRAHSFGSEQESPLRSYDFNSQTNGYREFFPPDYSWPPVGNNVRAHRTGPATGRFVPVAPRTSMGRDGWQSGEQTMEWRPGIGAGDIPVNLPAIPGSYPGPPENYRAKMGEIPLDERFDEPTSGFTGFDSFNSFGSRITENSNDALLRRFAQAKKSNPNIRLIKRGGGIDQLSGQQIPEQYFIQPTPEPDPSTGPEPVRPMIDPQDGIRQNQMMPRAADLVPMRPPSTSGFNPPRAGEFYYPRADGTWRTGTNYPPIAADDPYIATDAPPRMRETLPPVHPDSRLQYEILKGSFRPY